MLQTVAMATDDSTSAVLRRMTLRSAVYIGPWLCSICFDLFGSRRRWDLCFISREAWNVNLAFSYTVLTLKNSLNPSRFYNLVINLRIPTGPPSIRLNLTHFQDKEIPALFALFWIKSPFREPRIIHSNMRNTLLSWSKKTLRKVIIFDGRNTELIPPNFVFWNFALLQSDTPGNVS